jgi:hypothetical protein
MVKYLACSLQAFADVFKITLSIKENRKEDKKACISAVDLKLLELRGRLAYTLSKR